MGNGTTGKNIIFTIGTGLRSAEDFIEILNAYDVRSFIDVRSFPKSKLPHFSRSALEELLLPHQIEYHFLGRELGGLRKGGYTSYIVTKEFQDGIAALEAIAKQRVSVIACAEKFPWKCHRKWISMELQKGKVWVPK
jgi:uncharacterized protein (DUF488 family)